MPDQDQYKELNVVPINEVKKQVYGKNARGIHFKAPVIDPKTVRPLGSVIHPTWSKYPCPIKKGCAKKGCNGLITLIISVDAIKWFSRPITLIAIRKEQKTYIEYNRQFRKLQDEKILAPCKIITVSY